MTVFGFNMQGGTCVEIVADNYQDASAHLDQEYGLHASLVNSTWDRAATADDLRQVADARADLPYELC
jgi:hypothetical protein